MSSPFFSSPLDIRRSPNIFQSRVKRSKSCRAVFMRRQKETSLNRDTNIVSEKHKYGNYADAPDNQNDVCLLYSRNHSVGEKIGIKQSKITRMFHKMLHRRQRNVFDKMINTNTGFNYDGVYSFDESFEDLEFFKGNHLILTAMLLSISKSKKICACV